jgi:uncharacterized protein (TIGR02757 family)
MRRGLQDRSVKPVPSLRHTLDRLYADFNRADSAADPVQLVSRFDRADDREVVGFCAASLAFGRVGAVIRSVERVLAVMGSSPAAYVRGFNPGRERSAFEGLVHRWTRGTDLMALLWVLRQMLEHDGSIERFFLAGYDPSASDVGPALDRFSAAALALDLECAYGRVPARPGVAYFFPRPSDGSGCKRLNLFLRWMVRRDALDFGIWSGVSPAKLVIPLDTHVVRVGRCLQLTRRATPGWRMAREITESLRRLDPDDPVKYDYALCHLGMMNACGFGHPQGDSRCPLRGSCRPAGPRPRTSGLRRRPTSNR